MSKSTKQRAASCQSCSDPLPVQAIELLNSKCFCISLQEGALRLALKEELAAPDIVAMLEERCPHVFSARPVFLSASQTERMAQVVRAIESVVAMPAYRAQVLANAPDIARHDPGGAKGVFFGYDFHLHEDQLGLIEVNTNAGGAMLNAVLARAQHACCAVMDDLVSTAITVDALEASMVAMFFNEWRLCGNTRPLRSITIVDEAPQQQFLYPEFLLFQQLFQRHGLQAVIADPADLQWRDGVLWHDDIAIDLSKIQIGFICFLFNF